MTAATGFAEMFEWEDGNPMNEDRGGRTVVLVGDKIRIATDTDIPIGVIGGDNTAIAAISNASPMEWHGKHLRDPLNRLLWEPQSMVEWTDNGYRHWYEADRVPEGITVPEIATYYHDIWNGHKLQREILSEEFKNPNKTIDPYLPRWERSNWGIVVLLGRVMIIESSVCNLNWKKLKTVSGTVGGESVSEWLIH
jgi:hypothetical protein